MNIKKLQTEKVFLSPILEEDLDRFVAFMNEEEMTLFTGTFQGVYGREEERAYFHKGGSGVQLAIHDQKSGETIGLVEYLDIDEVNRSAEIGISIGDRNFRSKGYGRDAMALMLDYGFGFLNLHSVNLTVMASNERARRLYQSLGFQEAGRLREHRFSCGGYEDILLMDLLRSEYEYFQLNRQKKILSSLGKEKKDD